MIISNLKLLGSLDKKFKYILNKIKIFQILDIRVYLLFNCFSDFLQKSPF